LIQPLRRRALAPGGRKLSCDRIRLERYSGALERVFARPGRGFREPAGDTAFPRSDFIKDAGAGPLASGR
jgi:hypothetical protein